MKALLLVFFALLIGSHVQADGLVEPEVEVQRVTHEVEETLGWHTGSFTKIYYSCDYAERRVTDLLEELGATNVDIKCVGGFDPHGFTTYASIYGSFESLVQVAAAGEGELMTYSHLNLRGFEGCSLVSEVLHLFGDRFVMKDLKGLGSKLSSTCNGSRPYNVNLSIIK